MDKKQAARNPINKKDNKCVARAVLNHEQIGKHLGRITKIKTFVNKYNWKKKNFNQKGDTGKYLTKIM